MSAIDDLHIEDFCKDTTVAFLTLYKQFPQKVTLYVEDICGPDQPDEFGLHSPRFMAGFSALVWLAEHDYLRYDQLIRQEALEGAVLSHKGLLFLSGREPGAENPASGATRIEVLREIKRNGSSIQLREQVLHYLDKARDYR